MTPWYVNIGTWSSGAMPLNYLLAAWIQAVTLIIIQTSLGPQQNITHKMCINWSASTADPNMATVRVCVWDISLYTSNSNDASKQEVCAYEKLVLCYQCQLCQSFFAHTAHNKVTSEQSLECQVVSGDWERKKPEEEKKKGSQDTNMLWPLWS